MSVGSIVLVLAALPAGPLPAPSAPTSASPSSADEQTLKSANIGVSGPALLDFFHQRSGAAVDKARVAALVKQLAEPAGRDAAVGQLVAIGEPAAPALREAANNLDDPDLANRAHQCLDGIEGPHAAAVSMAAVRAVAALRPDGAADALLQFLPYAEDEKVEQEAETALAAVALAKDGKPASAVIHALADAQPVRRAAAAVALCHVGDEEQKAAVREMLRDPKPIVRFRTALALADSDSSEAMPVLIDALADLPNEQRKQAEEYLTDLAGEWAVAGPQGNDAVSRQLRRDAWSAWWRGIDDKGLLGEFQSRTMTDAERDKALDLIQKLDDASADVREKASTELVGMGRRVAPLLRQTAGGSNAHIAPFAQNCLQRIEKDTPDPLPAAAARLLAMRAPDGAVAALLGYLPYADSDRSGEELRTLLNSLAGHDPKEAPVLVKALDDKIGVRRSAAAVALLRAGGSGSAVKKLLKDADLDVRLRTATAAAAYAHDKDAVPVLIDLLTDLPQDRVWQAEAVLNTIAGEKAPAVSLVGDAEARKKGAAAWSEWWTANAASVDLAKIDFSEDHQLGYLLVVEMNFPGKPAGRVLEQNAAGQVLWQIEGVLWPQDAQVTRNNHIVLIDNNGQRVSEREIQTNKVVWETNVNQVNQAFRVQSLPNGNTFVAGRNNLIVLDRTGKPTGLNVQRNEWILDAQMFRDGAIGIVNNQGGYTRLDVSGKEPKEIKTGHIPFNLNFGVNGAEVLPNDHVLVAVWNLNKITEYDLDGKTVWEATVPQPSNFHRLPNGHTLVTCANQTEIMELDQTGKVAADMKNLSFHPWRVSRR
ncbi:MAG TPA: HEAT repeat domain-containing protein [Gemmataceae bacterium]|nr:HEAT repeat domain-containing protein [Gemmataceae bacterium]